MLPRLNETPPPAAPGEVIAGKYQVDAAIAVGGMGVVCEATHLELQKRVAIKFVRPELAQHEGFVSRFLNEARAAAALHSEHVAHVLDCGRLPTGAPYMVLEYLEGTDLAKALRNDGPLPTQRAVDYALQVCEALAEAHSKRLVHRDIKPDNLFLTAGPGGVTVIKVLDFGVSKQLESGVPSLTDDNQGIGSPHYMSPEQMTTPSEIDARSDIWSLGAVLYELIGGHTPFDGNTVPEVCAKVVTLEPLPLHRHAPNVPRRLEAVIMQCLEKDRDKRFADVGQLADALVPFASAEGAASAEVVARILGRIPTRRRSMVSSELDEAMSAPSTDRPSKDSIPGVGPSPWGALALFILLGGATIFGVVRLLYGGQAPGSTIDTNLAAPLPSAIAPSSSPSALVPSPAATAAPTTSASPSAVTPPTAAAAAPDAAAAPRPTTLAGTATPKPPGTATVPVKPPPASSGSPWPEPREVPKDLGDPRNVDPPGIGEQPLPE
jgi:eukaryotic-like serine/threonine-protein kinase